MGDLKVPYAMCSGELISANSAKKGKVYVCPLCGEELILRKGDVKIHHFAHKGDTQCSGESYIHRTAKLLIEQAVNNWLSDSKYKIFIERECSGCKKRKRVELRRGIVSSVRLEKKESSSSKYRIDVLLYHNKSPRVGIEIMHTHAVDENKHNDLQINYIELDADSVLEKPYYWNVIRSNHTFECFPCKSKREKVEFEREVYFDRYIDICHKIAVASGVKIIDSSFFRYCPTRCFNCSKTILAFYYDKSVTGVHTLRRPSSLSLFWRADIATKFRGNKIGLINTCPYCGAVGIEYPLMSDGMDVVIAKHLSGDYFSDMLEISKAYFFIHKEVSQCT